MEGAKSGGGEAGESRARWRLQKRLLIPTIRRAIRRLMSWASFEGPARVARSFTAEAMQRHCERSRYLKYSAGSVNDLQPFP